MRNVFIRHKVKMYFMCKNKTTKWIEVTLILEKAQVKDIRNRFVF